MTSLYVASVEASVGKSAVCAALFQQFRDAGYRTGYMKPVSVTAVPTESGTVDEDVLLMRSLFDLPESPEVLAPVLATPRVIEQVVRGEQPDYHGKVRAAYDQIAADRDVVILEGVNTWAEGAMLGLSADEVSKLLDARVLLVSRYRSLLSTDAILAVRQYLHEPLLGVVLNQVVPEQVDFVHSTVVPFLKSAGVPVLGVLPADSRLTAVGVQEIAEALNATVVVPDTQQRIIESLTVGAMGVDSALQFFRRKANKAVITGGDRADLQLAALETSTSCLILTGDIQPARAVVDRAQQRGVAVLVARGDTLSIVQQIEGLFGRMRFGRGDTQTRFAELARNGIDMQALIAAMNLAAPSGT
jgi:uncharacterized protein